MIARRRWYRPLFGGLCLMLLGSLAGVSGLWGCGGGSGSNNQLQLAQLAASWQGDGPASRQSTDYFLDFSTPTPGRQGANVLVFGYSPPGSATFTGTATFTADNADGTATLEIDNGPSTPSGIIANGATLTLTTDLSNDGNSLVTTLSNGVTTQTETWTRVPD